MSDDPCFASAADLAKSIEDGERSPVDLVGAFLDRIEARNDATNAHVTVLETDDVLAASAAFERVRPWHEDFPTKPEFE